MKILVLNCGSSSMKYKLYDMNAEAVLARGLADRIGLPESIFLHRAGKKELVSTHSFQGPGEALKVIVEALTHEDYGVIRDTGEITAVGHRVVHGGGFFNRPAIIDDVVLELLEKCSQLAPLHNPHNIKGIRNCRKLMPGALQVAVFDTAFHQTMPDYAYMYAIPHEYYKKHGLRKYGFHGTSHRYVSSRAAQITGTKLEDLRIITCHLGNGSSLCAVGGGRCRETTMGLTPLAGLVMGTRCGDIDPAIIPFLMEKEGLGAGDVLEILNKKSGVLGISGMSSDFRDIEQAALDGHPGCRLALDMYVYSVCKGIGALLPSIGGLDVLVFTAGIGEKSPEIRRRICTGLEFLGLFLDEEKNTATGREAVISSSSSSVQVLVIPTDEELLIARETRAMLHNAIKK